MINDKQILYKILHIISDLSFEFFRCNVLWYITPLSLQKTFLFLMHRMIKSLRPSFYNIVVASLEGFATVI